MSNLMQFYAALYTQWCLLMFLPFGSTEEIHVNFQMREETPPFTRIGSIGPSLPAGVGSKLHYLTDGKFFSVTPNTGEVRVARLIDRETLCSEHKLCCGLLACQIETRIFVTNRLTGELAASVKLKVDIQDQNDNRPTFTSSTQKVSISESATMGSFVVLSPALDADIEPGNQIQRYTLVEPTGTFSLDTSELPSVRLQLVKPLDRERIGSYTATLEACDPGACARQSLEIEVLDENDNKPVFVTTSFVERLMENIPVGNIILRLNATDADSGERGRVVYSMRGVVDNDLLETFELIQDTGEIRLKRGLAANIRDNYRFKVMACDAANPSCSADENSTADITLLVEDVNNFSPSIHVVAAGAAVISDDSRSDGQQESTTSDGLSVLENTPPSQVAVITVRDADLGDNARVNCELNESPSGSTESNFLLTPSAPGIYSLRTSRMFDHEVEPTVRTKVVCHDYGSPERLTAARMIVIKVGDVNEFQPEFSRRVYSGRVPENAPAGMEIVTASATDRDRGAVLRYMLAPSSLQQVNWNRANSDLLSVESTDINKHFVIEPETGTLRTSQIPLDRESIASVTLTVLATDAEFPPIFTATTSVSIDILDENDNAPLFVNPPTESISPTSAASEHIATRAFTVMENSPRFTRLSEQLEARDPDQGDNGRFIFSLLTTYALLKPNQLGHMQYERPPVTDEQMNLDPSIDAQILSEFGTHKKIVDHPIFRITPDGGIETLVELDREAVSTYLLKISVQDRGAQPLTSTTLLRVDVLDANDNSPMWIFPTPVDRTINLTTAMKPGNLAGRLRAEDADMGEAGKVEYMFLGPRGELLRAVSLEDGLIRSISEDKEADRSPKGNGEKKLPVQSDDDSFVEHGYRVSSFYLNGTTGEIWIADLLTAGTITLHLRAKDRGSPSSQTDAWLTINVFVDPTHEMSFFNFGGDGTLNITIILVMITITAIVSLFLIVGIVCVRRRPARYVAGRNAAGNGDGLLPPSGANSPYLIDNNKEAMNLAQSAAWSTPAGIYAPGQYYPNQGGQVVGRMSEDGQYFTTIGASGVMGYGAMMAQNDGHSIIYVPHGSQPGLMNGGSVTPVPVDHSFVPLDYAGTGHLQTFGTLGRPRASVSGSSYHMPPNCSMNFEPHLDADSGDSGRGPSEEGTQFLMSENSRNGFNPHGPANVYPYHTYAGYRPSSRMAFRTIDEPIKMQTISCPHGSNGDCGCCNFVPQHGHQYPMYSVGYGANSQDYNPLANSPSYSENDTGQYLTGQPVPLSQVSDDQPENNLNGYGQANSPNTNQLNLLNQLPDQAKTNSSSNGINTPLRIDLRKPNFSEETDLQLATPDAISRPNPSLNLTRNVPSLPPLATRKASVTSNQGNTP